MDFVEEQHCYHYHLRYHHQQQRFESLIWWRKNIIVGVMLPNKFPRTNPVSRFTSRAQSQQSGTLERTAPQWQWWPSSRRLLTARHRIFACPSVLFDKQINLWTTSFVFWLSCNRSRWFSASRFMTAWLLPFTFEVVADSRRAKLRSVRKAAPPFSRTSVRPSHRGGCVYVAPIGSCGCIARLTLQ